jgi:hypothetical protein
MSNFNGTCPLMKSFFFFVEKDLRFFCRVAACISCRRRSACWRPLIMECYDRCWVRRDVGVGSSLLFGQFGSSPGCLYGVKIEGTPYECYVWTWTVWG